MKTSTLSAAQWQDLESKARAMHQAMTALTISLTEAAMHCHHNEDSALCDKLLDESNKIHNAMLLGPYHYHCQPEWTGGDSSDPANHKLVEPHIAGTRRTVA